VYHVAYITFILKTNKMLKYGLWMPQKKTGISFYYMLDATKNKRDIV